MRRHCASNMTIAVSAASWLVAPQCTKPAAAGVTFAVSMLTNGMAGVPARSDWRTSSATSKPSGTAACVMAAAASAGMRPTFASARASADSKPSIASKTERSEKISDNDAVAARLSMNRVDIFRSYTSKKTVSLSPCKRISKNQSFGWPGMGLASKVARRSCGTKASTGSMALAASPAK